MDWKKNWGTHAEFLITLLTLLGGFYMLDSKIDRAGEKTAQQSARTDKVYEMFVEMQKELKELHCRTAIVETKIEMKKS